LNAITEYIGGAYNILPNKAFFLPIIGGFVFTRNQSGASSKALFLDVVGNAEPPFLLGKNIAVSAALSQSSPIPQQTRLLCAPLRVSIKVSRGTRNTQ